MRWVRVQSGVSPPQEWSDRAGCFTRDLLSATSENERKQIIEDHEDLWKDPGFKNWFIDLFYKKCWYTESKEKVSAYHVDHFRPKGRLTDETGTSEGYSWLAFKWENYRVAGQLINVKKRDKFPVKGIFRATLNDQNIEKEEALLIDPLDNVGVSLLSFDESGEVVEAAGISDEDKSRVEVTKDILGLNKIQTLIEARQQKWQECFRHIQDFLKANKRAEPTRTAFKACAINELRKLVKEDKEFLAVALACILKKAPEHLQNAIF